MPNDFVKVITQNQSTFVKVEIFALSLVMLLSVACENIRPIANDSRFADVIASGVRTKRELRLYPPGIGVSDSGGRYSLSEGYFATTPQSWDYVAVVPAHHPVNFEKVRRVYDFSGGSEYLLGNIELKGEDYPVSYWLGLLNNDSETGWRCFFRSFEADR